jgi:hypothetical protein
LKPIFFSLKDHFEGGLGENPEFMDMEIPATNHNDRDEDDQTDDFFFDAQS